MALSGGFQRLPLPRATAPGAVGCGLVNQAAGRLLKEALVGRAMALVLSERDYKLVTMFTKIAGIFIFAAGSINLVDFGRVFLGPILMLIGIAVVLAPVPMSVVQPSGLAEAEADGYLEVNE